MSRGLGGVDGPSVFMFVAVVLIWGQIKSLGKSAKDTIVGGLELGQNTAGPLQAQTSKDIRNSEDAVKTWAVAWSTLPKSRTHYQSIADFIWREVQSVANIDEDAIISALAPLTAQELRAVAVTFGVKEASIFGLTTWSGHIFQALDLAFEGMFKENDRARLKAVWAKTKLW